MPCKYGKVYPFDEESLILEAVPKPANRVLREVPGATLYRHADNGADIRFPVTEFDAVAEIAKPRKRRRCHLTPDQLAAAAERLRAYRFAPADTER